MAIQPETLLGHRFAALTQAYDERDAILYALGIGLGADPLDEAELAYLIETRLAVLPTMAVTLASPGMWIRDPAFGIDFAKLVHSAQDTLFHAALPARATVTATPRVAGLHDRGAGKGAVLIVEREVRDAGSDMLYATVRQTLLLRGDGGFGGPPAPPSGEAMPDGAPDLRLSLPTSRRAALIYRLSGDWNPLHADPAFARSAGFDRPILQGLASYGIAGWALMKAAPGRLTRLACRFSGIVMPGDMLDFSIWTRADGLRFEARVGDRRILDQGHAIMESK